MNCLLNCLLPSTKYQVPSTKYQVQVQVQVQVLVQVQVQVQVQVPSTSTSTKYKYKFDCLIVSLFDWLIDCVDMLGPGPLGAPGPKM